MALRLLYAYFIRVNHKPKIANDRVVVSARFMGNLRALLDARTESAKPMGWFEVGLESLSFLEEEQGNEG